MVNFTPTLDCAQLAQGCALMAGAGVATHLAYFIRGDHNLFAYRWIPRALTAIGVLGLILLYLTRFRVLDSVVATTLFTTSYFTGLYTSISTYRLFFHPLRVFPGPFWARLSNLYHAYIIRNSDNALVIQKLHQKYGPIVRTGESTPFIISRDGTLIKDKMADTQYQAPVTSPSTTRRPSASCSAMSQSASRARGTSGLGRW